MSFFSDFKEITPEEAEKLLDELARRLYKYNLDTVSVFLLQSFKPFIPFGAKTVGLFSLPWLEFVGIRGYEYYQLFSNEEYVERLMQKIEKLVEEEKEKKR